MGHPRDEEDNDDEAEDGDDAYHDGGRKRWLLQQPYAYIYTRIQECVSTSLFSFLFQNNPESREARTVTELLKLSGLTVIEIGPQRHRKRMLEAALVTSHYRGPILGVQ